MKYLAVGILLIYGVTSCDLFEGATGPGPLTDAEITQGLREALSIGLDNSVVSASATDGYLKNELIKILLPAEVTDLQTKIQTESVLGGTIPLSTVYNLYIDVENNGNDLFDDLITGMNRGAESAATKALPIFGNALANMSITDALSILEGNETAATDFFYAETNTALFSAFNPEMKSALDATGANQIYTSTIGFLNYEYSTAGGLVTLTPNEFINVDLPATMDEYATTKAIDGLFFLIGEEEKKIRLDPFAWASSIIERVFGSQN
ncbi:MAG: DUF4197 domain-containing protein [Cyclobacteriaceae bacterium]